MQIKKKIVKVTRLSNCVTGKRQCGNDRERTYQYCYFIGILSTLWSNGLKRGFPIDRWSIGCETRVRLSIVSRRVPGYDALGELLFLAYSNKQLSVQTTRIYLQKQYYEISFFQTGCIIIYTMHIVPMSFFVDQKIIKLTKKVGWNTKLNSYQLNQSYNVSYLVRIELPWRQAHMNTWRHVPLECSYLDLHKQCSYRLAALK